MWSESTKIMTSRTLPFVFKKFASHHPHPHHFVIRERLNSHHRSFLTMKYITGGYGCGGIGISQNMSMLSSSVRNLSTLSVTNNLKLITDTPKPLTLKKSGGTGSTKFTVEAQGSTTDAEAPLLLLPTWLLAEKKHVMKYAQIYLDQGFHVLWIPCSPRHLLFPTLNGAKTVGHELLTFLENNPQYKSKMIHGFSVGGFIWSQVLITFEDQPVKYKPLMDTFKAQIWDSLVDIEGLSGGVGGAVFPNRPVLKKIVELYGRFHVVAFKNLAMKHYLDARRVYYKPIVKCPAIHFCSEDDPVALFHCVKRITDIWKETGIQTNVKSWKTSQHILHFQKHPEEYKVEMRILLDQIGLLRHPDRFPV